MQNTVLQNKSRAQSMIVIWGQITLRSDIDESATYLVNRTLVNRQILILQKQEYSNRDIVQRLKRTVAFRIYGKQIKGDIARYSFRPTSLVRMSGRDIKECFVSFEIFPSAMVRQR